LFGFTYTCKVGRAGAHLEAKVEGEGLMGSQEANCDVRSREFVRLFQQHERKIYGYILALVPNIVAAEEISQETNLRLWEQFDQFDPHTHFGVWACTVAYYQVLKYRKASERSRVRFDSRLLEILADRAVTRLDDLTLRQNYLIDCLSQLSEFKRQVIRLYYSLGLTAKAVAEKLGRNVDAVEKTLVRTRQTLRDCIEAGIRREERA
jgi:RNA polymerase sigma-70 factor, ECF subfamily